MAKPWEKHYHISTNNQQFTTENHPKIIVRWFRVIWKKYIILIRNYPKLSFWRVPKILTLEARGSDTRLAEVGLRGTNLGWGRWGRFSTTFLYIFYADLSDFFWGYRVLHYELVNHQKKDVIKSMGMMGLKEVLVTVVCNYRKYVLNWTKSSHPIFRRSDFSMLGFGRGVSMPAQRFTASSHWFQHDFGWAQEQFCGLEMFMGSLKNTTQMFGKQIIIIEIHGNLQVTWWWKQSACYLVVFFHVSASSPGSLQMPSHNL